jgi:hypothetical protein
MKSPLPDVRLNSPAMRHSGAVLVGALLLSWFAIYNRYPLLYPDSMSYIEQGRQVARALLLRRLSPGNRSLIVYGDRSLIYGLGILPFHWNRTPWPVVGLNVFLTAWVVWLVVRSMRPRHLSLSYLVLIVFLSAFTGLAWFTSLIMPDILGPLLYLSIYLLVFAGETISRTERPALWVIAWWGMTSHGTHLILAAGLCVVLPIFLALQGIPRSSWMRAMGEVTAIIAVAAAAQIALNFYLYGEPSLNGKRPPFLMARVISDGPGRWYLQQHCGQTRFTICDYLPVIHEGITSSGVLWASPGIWRSASPTTRRMLRAEETRFVLATIRAYPREQLRFSARDFKEQLTTFGLWGYQPNSFVLEVFDHAFPGRRFQYLRSRQAHADLPAEFSSAVQTWAVVASVVLIVVLAAFRLRHLSRRLLELTVIVVSMVIANAFVTGVLSEVLDRYQSRVVWLLPLLAGLFVLDCVRGSDEKVVSMGAAAHIANP